MLGAVAFASAILWGLSRRASDDDDPTLPEYAAAGSPVRVGPKGTRFEILVRPSAPLATRVAAWAFALGEPGSEPTPLLANVAVSTDGTVTIGGPSEVLANARELRVVLSSAGVAKFDAAAERARTGQSDATLRVLVVPVAR